MAINSFISAPILHSAIDVGKRVTKAYADELQGRFRSTYPNLPTEVVISNKAILAALAAAPNVSGVKFVFGMKNEQEVTSLFLTLIPCTSVDTGAVAYTPVKCQTFTNHLGELLSEEEITACLDNFRNYQIGANSQMKEEQAHEANFFGRKILEEVTTGEGRVSVRFSFGRMKIGYLQLVMEPLDINNWSIWEELFDYSNPIPPN